VNSAALFLSLPEDREKKEDGGGVNKACGREDPPFLRCRRKVEEREGGRGICK
jgi:hypothetical protein